MPLAEHLKLHRLVYGVDSYPSSLLPSDKEYTSTAPSWVPCPEAAKQTNISSFAVARGFPAGLPGYPHLLRWSREPSNRPAFWDAYKDVLGIVYKDKARTQINIVDSCFNAPPDRVAVRGDNGEVWTFKRYRQLVNQYSNALRAMGCVKGDAVGLLAPMTPYACAIYLVDFTHTRNTATHACYK
jgi:hypothetical protein